MRILLSSYKFLVATAILIMVGYQVRATHLRAGEITVVRDNCNSLQFRITITVYTNTGSSVLFGGRVGEEDILNFGDGTSMLVPETPNTLRPDLGPNIGTASFTVVHTYPGPGQYTISYREPNRNEGVLNMDNSVNTRFYIETLIKIDPFLGCNNSPKLLIAPIDQACSGVAFFHNPGAYDPDGDSLSYELVTPYSDRGLPVVRYQDPAADAPRDFYSDFGIGNEDGNGPPSFAIHPVEGDLEWNAPGAQGEYNIAFVIREWREVAGQGWVEVGFVRRDMQILVNECDNERPDLIIPIDTCIEAGTTLSETILGIDPENHPVKIEAFSEIFNFGAAQSPATISPAPDFRPSNPPFELNFEWNTICDHVKEQPYQVVFKITDNPGNTGPKLVTFKTWNIKVVGPKPVWQSATINPNERSTALDWEDYSCTNAQTMQIYRRVDSFPYTPANCETGMPDFLGYELIQELPISGASSFVDTNGGSGLAPGARYCYRLVAVFPAPKGGESFMSEEICVGPILADAPVITNVTVDTTDQVNGQITIIWREPFDLDPAQFPPPYTYQVFRGTGFTGVPTVNVTGTPTDQLAFVDTGLNTTDEVYHYSVVAYDANNGFVDSSAIASSVRLEAQSDLKRIAISWSAFVPWTNNSPSYPLHSIYRGPEGSTEDELELIDEVNVNVNGFVYVDEGQFNGEPLRDDQVYCYRVMTRGAYGNPQIDEPLINFSQIVCAQPSDSIPPCQVAAPVSVEGPDCSNYSASDCSKAIFSNRIEWTRPNEGTCQNDILYYNVYSASSSDGAYILLASGIKDLFYVDQNLPSYARCYRVSAVDRSGNEGDQSEPLCIDNCPYYELPNVFTPNGDLDGCNNVFSAYGVPQNTDGEGGFKCGGTRAEDASKCARFVDRVEFTVYNRWGKEVYSYSSGGEGTIYINWDGRDDNGKELSGGVYYYIAEVTFITIDPAKRNQTIKGWVHIFR